MNGIRHTNLVAVVAMAFVCMAIAALGSSRAFGQETSDTTAQEQNPPSPPEAPSPWSFRVTSYLWLAGLDGDVGIRGLQPVDVDISFGEVFDAIDWFPPPIMIAGEVRYDRLAFLTDFIHLGLEDNGTAANGLLAAQLNTNTLIWTFAGSYRAVQYDPVTLDLLAGGRLWNLHADASVAAPGITLSANNSKTWVDPIVGLIARVELGSGFAFEAEGDVGGFGLVSDIDWQVVGTIQYQLNDSVSLNAGYRYLAVDYRDGGFVFDMAMRGPIIGASIRF